MAVTLSLFAGAGAQFFDNSGNVLSGGKIYTYQAGTTTPLAVYTSNTESAFHTNPIILDAAGRVPSGGEIWLQLGIGYKFVLKTSTDVLIATYDNIPSSAQPPAANDANSIMYEQGYTVTAGSFVVGKIYRIVSVGTTNFTLIGATSNTVGTHFIATGVGTGTGTAELSQTVETKLRETVSVKDFGAVGNGVTDDTAAIQAAIDYAITAGAAVYFPAATAYLVANTIYLPDGTSNPFASLNMYGDYVPNHTTSDTSAGTDIAVTASVLFASKTTPSGSGSLPSVAISMKGLLFRTNYTTNPTAICFSTMNLFGSKIEGCGFYGFDTWLYGSTSSVAVISQNSFGVRRMIKRHTSYTNVCVDSKIVLNYISGLGGTPAGLTTDPLVDLVNAARVTLSDNYIDFTYIAVSTGGSGDNVIIKNNVFDICYRAILLVYGFSSRLIDGNTFLRISKSDVSFFYTPLAGMSSNNWVCLLMENERLANTIIVNNTYNYADEFFTLGTKGIWNVKESNNIGTYDVDGSPSPAAVVNFGTRSIDTVNYPLDNTLIRFESLEDSLNSSIRQKRFAYVGLSYYLGSPPVRVRVNSDYSLSGMNGDYLLGKTNLLPATDFASGWTFNTGISEVGGVFTASSGSGWSYTALVLSAGTYIVTLNIATLSAGDVTVGWSATGTPSTYVASSITTYGLTVGSPVNVATRCNFQLNVTTTTARLAIFLSSGTTCTIDYINAVKVA